MKSFLSTCGDPSVTSVAIGKFDGLHLGHQALFEALDSRGAILVIDTLRGNLTPRPLQEEIAPYPLHRLELAKIRDLSGEAFMKLLADLFPALQKIVVGSDFRFGQGRRWGVEELCMLFKGRVVAIPQFLYRGVAVRSGAIRELLREGDVVMAGTLLGRDYCMEGSIIQGNGLGSRELFATINLEVSDFLLPKDGVYVTEILLGPLRAPSISFVGKRLSVDDRFAIETHLLGIESMEGIPSVPSARVYFKGYLRENRHFSELPLLKKQIAQDIEAALAFHAHHTGAQS